MYQSRFHEVEELLDIWHGLQQSAVDSAVMESASFRIVRAEGEHFGL